MENVYLVIRNCSCESSGTINMQSIKVFADYKSAKKEFEEQKKEIKNYNLGYDEIEDEKDYYCESVDGEYLYYHELVYIRKEGVN
jgi:hypothetical protein